MFWAAVVILARVAPCRVHGPEAVQAQHQRRESPRPQGKAPPFQVGDLTPDQLRRIIYCTSSPQACTDDANSRVIRL
jgi:hypothetical protein